MFYRWEVGGLLRGPVRQWRAVEKLPGAQLEGWRLRATLNRVSISRIACAMLGPRGVWVCGPRAPVGYSLDLFQFRPRLQASQLF